MVRSPTQATIPLLAERQSYRIASLHSLLTPGLVSSTGRYVCDCPPAACSRTEAFSIGLPRRPSRYCAAASAIVCSAMLRLTCCRKIQTRKIQKLVTQIKKAMRRRIATGIAPADR